MLGAGSALAQLSISGTVNDPQGTLADATVTLAGPNVSARETSSDAAGKYRLEGVAPGKYDLRVARSGFETAAQSVTLTDQPAVVDITLKLGVVSTVVEVTDTIEVAGRATASRMAVSELELPVQVSSVSRSVLESQGANDMVSALRNVSGATAFRAYGMYEYYTIRGFNIPYQSSVHLVDGMRLEGNRFNTQLTNVERIEVLKGPGSILFGGQAMSGAINMIRKKPQAARTYDFFYRGGRFNTHNVGGGTTGRVFNSNRLLYRVDAGYENSDAWRNAGARRLNVSPSITWVLGERSRVTFNQAFNRDDFDGDAGVPVGVLSIPNFDLSRRFNTPQDYAHIRDSQTQILMTIGFATNWEFRNSFFYRYTNDQYYTAETLTYQPTQNLVERQFLYFQHHRRPVLNQADVTGRFKLLGMNHTVLAGYEYEDYFNFTDRAAQRSIKTTPMNLSTFQETHVAIPDYPLSRVDYFSNLINAFFWQDQISVTNKLKINVGGRLDDFRYRAHNDPWANGAMTSRGPELRRHQTPYTYRVGAVYYLTNSQQLFASSSSSFQPITTVPADGKELKPENGRAFEVGHRWQGFQGRLTVNTSLYRLVRRNVLIALQNNLFDQAGQQSSKGVDIDITGNLRHGVSLIANYGYTLPRYDDYFANNGTQNLSGFRPRFTQRHAANLWLTKSWQSGFTASLGTRYVGSMFTSDQNVIKLGGWTTFSGAVSWRRPKYEVSLNAENLFNRQRYFLPAQIANQVYPGAPINVFTSVRLFFR
jgi:iron complex outermembrane receptor protein